MNATTKQCLILLQLVLIAGCVDLVPLKPGADTVNLFIAGNVSDCVLYGPVQVSVMGKLGPIDRDPLAVENELNTLAKNSAFASGGDTAIASGPVKDGARDFKIYKCKK